MAIILLVLAFGILAGIDSGVGGVDHGISVDEKETLAKSILAGVGTFIIWAIPSYIVADLITSLILKLYPQNNKKEIQDFVNNL